MDILSKTTSRQLKLSCSPENLPSFIAKLNVEAGLTRNRTLQGKKAGSLHRLFIGKPVTNPTKGGVVHVFLAFETIAAVSLPSHPQPAISKTCSKKRGYYGFT
jgi:hypothetical protein